MEEWRVKADRVRERLVFDGRIQGCGANMKFLSKQPFSIKMTYICRERGVGGIGANHVAQKPLPPSAAFFLLRCCCLFNWNVNGCAFYRQHRIVVLCEVKWTSGLRAVYLPMAAVIARRRATSHLAFLFSCFSTHILCLISLRCEICVDLLSLVCTCSLYILPCLSPRQVSLLPPRCISVMECVLVVAFSFPSLSLPLSMGTLGLRQSCVAMAAGYVAELCTPGIWSLSP